MADLATQLLKSGALTSGQLAHALAASKDGDVASAALRLGLAGEGVLARALADHHGCPAVDFSRSVVPTANLTVVAPAYCRQHRVLPVSIGQSEMVLAMADPEDHLLADELGFVTGRKVLRNAAVPAAIERVIDGLTREKSRGGQAWHGPGAPALPDAGSAWVGVVHGSSKHDSALELPDLLPDDALEVVQVSEENAQTPFDAPTPARKERPREIEMEEPTREGSTLEFSIPPASERPTVRLRGLGAGKLALVADPNPETRDEMVKLLAALGCTVLQAANGRAALEIVREARPDLVTLEAIMPMTPGFEVCRAVKGDPVLRVG